MCIFQAFIIFLRASAQSNARLKAVRSTKKFAGPWLHTFVCPSREGSHQTHAACRNIYLYNVLFKCNFCNFTLCMPYALDDRGRRLVLLCGTDASFFSAAPTPRSSLRHWRLVLLCGTDASFFSAAPTPRSSLRHRRLVLLCGTEASFFSAALYHSIVTLSKIYWLFHKKNKRFLLKAWQHFCVSLFHLEKNFTYCCLDDSRKKTFFPCFSTPLGGQLRISQRSTSRTRWTACVYLCSNIPKLFDDIPQTQSDMLLPEVFLPQSSASFLFSSIICFNFICLKVHACFG